MNQPGETDERVSTLGRIVAHVVGVGVLLHLIAVALMAIPSPAEAVNRQAWSDPTVQAELVAWSQNLRRLGVDADAARLEDWLWRTTLVYGNVRAIALRPFGSYYEHCGTRQSWCMFAAPNLHPTRIHIEIEVGESWRPVYIARSPRHTWRSPTFSHDRFRAQLSRFGWGLYKWRYEEFLDWLAGEVRRDFPEAGRMRVRFFKETLRDAAAVRRGDSIDGEFVHLRRIDLS